MTVSYALRLLCISLAAFFLVHLILGAIVSLLTPLLSRMASRVPAAKAARILFVIRMYPAVGSILIVLGLCVPSFLRFETVAGAEEIGWTCFAAAILGGAVWSISIVRGARAAIRSFGYLRRCRKVARRLPLSHEPAPLWVLDRPEPCLIMAGVFRPQIVISQGVVDGLTPEQLAASLEHERAHCASRDNLKRLALLAVPGLLPGVNGFGRLEKAWARFAEWAADDSAVQGDSLSSIFLASALVRVARMGAPRPLEPLMTSLIADTQELSVRVERLLRVDPPAGLPRSWKAGSLLLPAFFLLVLLQPAATLEVVHHLIEGLVR
jgi:Zn-dependent protease with chaperone function